MDPLTGVGNSAASTVSAGAPPVAAAGSGRPPAPAAAPAQPAPRPPVDAGALQQAVNGINEYLKSVNNAIEFSVDQKTGSTIVKVTDNTTGKVVRQIPSETVLALREELDKLAGLLVHTQA